MRPIKRFWPTILFFLIVVFFFWPSFLKGRLPFPGDLLVAEYTPWSTYSYLGYLPGTFPHKAQYFDTLRQIYPWKSLAFDLMKEGNLPLWNPHNFSGSPLLANFQSAVFYPLNIFYLFLPQAIAWTLLVILQPLLAGFFVYLFAQEIGLKKTGAFVAAIIFSYSGFMTVFLEYNTIGQTILCLPLACYLFERLLKKQTFWRSFLFSLSLTVSFFAGHLPSAGLVFGFVAVYGFFRIWSAKRKFSIKTRLSFMILFLLILSLGMAAIQLGPTLELFNQSARTSHDYRFLIEKLLIQPKQLIMLLVPDFFGNPATHNYWLTDTYPGKVTYVGLVSLIFSLFASIFLRKNHFVRFFALVAGVVFLLIVSWPLTHFIYKLRLPFLSTSSPGNAIFLITFCLAILAGFGIDYWFKEKWKNRLLINVALLIVFSLTWVVVLMFPKLLGIASRPDFVSISLRNLFYSSLVFSVFIVVFALSFLRRGWRLITFLLVLVIVFDLFYFFRKFNPFVPEALVFPQAKVLFWLKENAGINRFWGYGAANIEANFASQSQLFSPQGYDPLYPKRYGEFIYSSREGKILEEFDASTRSDAVVAPGFGEIDLSANPYREKVLDLLGVKYVLDRAENASTEKTFPPGRYRLIWKDQGWRIFENLMATPRVFLVGSYVLFNEKEEFEKIFFAPDFKIQEKVLLEEKPEPEPQPAKLAQVEINNYASNNISLETTADVNQLLFLSDTFYPGWRAFVDGQATKIYRADYAFRAIAVPAGEHQILFSYEPLSFAWGVKISLASLALTLIFSFLWEKQRFFKK